MFFQAAELATRRCHALALSWPNAVTYTSALTWGFGFGPAYRHVLDVTLTGYSRATPRGLAGRQGVRGTLRGGVPWMGPATGRPRGDRPAPPVAGRQEGRSGCGCAVG